MFDGEESQVGLFIAKELARIMMHEKNNGDIEYLSSLPDSELDKMIEDDVKKTMIMTIVLGKKRMLEDLDGFVIGTRASTDLEIWETQMIEIIDNMPDPSLFMKDGEL